MTLLAVYIAVQVIGVLLALREFMPYLTAL